MSGVLSVSPFFRDGFRARFLPLNRLDFFSSQPWFGFSVWISRNDWSVCAGYADHHSGAEDAYAVRDNGIPFIGVLVEHLVRE